MRPRQCDGERGQATVEFALTLPLVVVLLSCIIGVTVVCLDVLRTDDLARTAARLASVSASPEMTARDWISDHAAGTSVSVSSDGSTVTVRLVRRLIVRIPLLDKVGISLPYGASAIAPLEPPPDLASSATNVAP